MDNLFFPWVFHPILISVLLQLLAIIQAWCLKQYWFKNRGSIFNLLIYIKKGPKINQKADLKFLKMIFKFQFQNFSLEDTFSFFYPWQYLCIATDLNQHATVDTLSKFYWAQWDSVLHTVGLLAVFNQMVGFPNSGFIYL